MIDFINRLPDNERSSYSFSFAIFHEFAHQLQFWNNDETLIETFSGLEKNVRKVELAADCVSAGLMSYQNRILMKGDDLKIAVQGIVGAARAYGDFNFDSFQHHGTPAERNAAVERGISYGLYDFPLGITSKALLNKCNQGL